MEVEVFAKNTSPLCILPSGKLVTYKKGKISVYDSDGKLEVEHRIFDDIKEKYLSCNPLLFRLLRLGIRCAYPLDNEHIIISKGNYIFELDLTTGHISNGFFCGQGIRPLIFTSVENISGFKDGIYFGGYLSNPSKKEVSIYRRIDVDKWEIVYTFPTETINHVHNIITDNFRNCLWIFTGDFDKSSAIWRVTNGFESIEYCVGNNQQYRGCVVFSHPEGLLYATDAPFAANYIYLFDPETKSSKKLFEIHGSCIYGTKWNDDFVFSSTIEGDGRNTSRFEFYFGRKKGAGIKDDFIHLYKGNLENGFEEIYKLKKDIMPFYTFQFGVFRFPYGQNNSDSLFFHPVATNKHDLSILKFIKEN